MRRKSCSYNRYYSFEDEIFFVEDIIVENDKVIYSAYAKDKDVDDKFLQMNEELIDIG